MKKIYPFLCLSVLVLSLAACNNTNKDKETYTLNYTKDATITLGTALNPNDFFTIVDSKNNPVDSNNYYLTLVTGDPNKVGEVQYLVVFGDKSFPLSINITAPVNESKTDTVDELLKSMMKKDYSNITLGMVYTFSSNGTEAKIIETDKILSDSRYEISYEDTDKNKMHFFVDQVEGDRVYIYLENNTTHEYSNTPLTYAQWESLDYDGSYYYSDYYTNYASPTSFNLMANELTMENNLLKVNDNRLDIVGEKIFALNDDNATFTSITIESKDGAFYKIVGTYESSDEQGEFSCKIEYTYSDIGTTTFILPDVAPIEVETPEHIDPSTAVALTDEQKAILKSALEAEFASYELTYEYNEDDGYYVENEHDLVTNGVYKIDYSYSAYYGYLSGDSKYYFEIVDGQFFVYYINEAKEYQKNELKTNDELNNYAPYACSPKDFGMSVDSFGYVDGKFVATNDGLVKENTNFSNDASTSLISLNVELDSNNNVSTIDLLMKTSDENGISFTTMKYSYSNIGNVNVTTPELGTTIKELSEEQKINFEEAVSKDYSNVTIEDTLFDSKFYFDGEYVKSEVIDSNNQVVVDNYHIKDERYYEITDDGEVEIPFAHTSINDESSFDYFVPVMNFSGIDVAKVKYDSANDCYFIDGDNINLGDFLYYYCDDFIERLNGISFELDSQNNITKVIVDFSNASYGNYNTYGLELSNFGTTKIEK